MYRSRQVAAMTVWRSLFAHLQIRELLRNEVFSGNSKLGHVHQVDDDVLPLGRNHEPRFGTFFPDRDGNPACLRSGFKHGPEFTQVHFHQSP